MFSGHCNHANQMNNSDTCNQFNEQDITVPGSFSQVIIDKYPLRF